jgi:hypothetical protein
VNSITGIAAAYFVQPRVNSVPSDKTVKGTSLTNSILASQTEKQRVVDTNANKGESTENSKPADISHVSAKQPVSVMSKVVEVYNLQGKVRTKFMDSNNNVVYQVPSEMVAKMEDQMMRPETSANIKG